MKARSKFLKLIATNISSSNFLSALTVLTILTGCGGGGTSTDTANQSAAKSPAQTTQRLAFNKLPQSEVDEESDVQLSLNASGDSAKDLQYDWSVSYAGAKLPFTGQNTDSIQFKAPNVDDKGVVTVSVEMSLKGGVLFGDKRDSTTILVRDLDPSTAISYAAKGSLTELEVVESLNISTINSGTTWSLNRYEASNIDVIGTLSTLRTSTYQITHLDLNLSGELQSTSCNKRKVSEVPVYGITKNLQCGSTVTNHFYQETGAFRVEARCEGKVISAYTYKMMNSNAANNFGHLAIDFESFPDLDVQEAVCGTIALQEIEVPSSDASTPITVNHTSVAIEVSYQNEPLTLSLILKGEPEFGVYGLSQFSDEDNINSIGLYSSQLGKVSGFNESDKGSVSLYTSGIDVIEGRFDLEVNTQESISEKLDGTFSLNLLNP